MINDVTLHPAHRKRRLIMRCMHRIGLRSSLLCSLLLLASAPALLAAEQAAANQQHQTAKMQVFFYARDTQQNQLADALRMQLANKLADYQAEFVDLGSLSQRDIDDHITESSQCLVTLGEQASQKILSLRIPLPHYGLLVPRSQLDKLHRVYQRLGIFVSGIYEEQPFYRQLNLARALQPDLQQIGVLLDQSDKFYLPEMLAESDRQALQLNYRILRSSDSPDKFLEKVASENGFMMIQNNRQLFMQSKLAALVLSAYYQKVRLVGSRVQDSEIGTLASVFTSAESLAVEAADGLQQVCKNGRKPKPGYANSFSVMVNQQIAENTAAKDYNVESITRIITQLESSRPEQEKGS